MKKIFLIDGAMRPAKYEIVSYLKELSKTYHGDEKSQNFLVTKYTSKRINEEDYERQDYIYKEDLQKAINDKPEEWITYHYSGDVFGLKVKDVNEAIEQHENVFIIIRSTELIAILKNKYEKRGFKVITIYIYSDRKIIELSYKNSQEKSQTANDLFPDIKERKTRLKIADADFENAMAKFSNIYDEILIYSAQDAIGSASIKSKLYGLLKKYDAILETNSVFIIHSFLEKERADNLLDCIKKSCEKLKGPKAKCESLLYGTGSYFISETVFEFIENHDFIVCDITPDRDINEEKSSKMVSPNIWIELGYAFSVIRKRGVLLGKKLVIICEKKFFTAANLPADIQGYNIMVYAGMDDLKSILERFFENVL